jgi:hypothetical protein
MLQPLGSFSYCSQPCENQVDCPEGDGGTAAPRCANKACRLDCSGNASCPDGMTCLQLNSGPGTSQNTCFW